MAASQTVPGTHKLAGWEQQEQPQQQHQQHVPRKGNGNCALCLSFSLVWLASLSLSWTKSRDSLPCANKQQRLWKLLPGTTTPSRGQRRRSHRYREMASTAARNSIAVAVRIRPPTSKEAAQLAGASSSSAAAAGFFNGDGSLTARSTSAASAGGLRRIIRAVDDRVLVFDPADSNPLAATSKQILGTSDKKVKDTRFCFDRVFGESATQQEVYDTSARELVPGVFDGYNATVFAYGVRSSPSSMLIADRAENQPAALRYRQPVAARHTQSRARPTNQASSFCWQERSMILLKGPSTRRIAKSHVGCFPPS